MDFKVVIPARYASTRLPGKPLTAIADKPLIQHVFERAQESRASDLVVATDDARIAEVVEAFGAQVAMTRREHRSGTDRIAEVIEQAGWADDTIVVNLQGDEPCMPAVLIDQVASDMGGHEKAVVTTLSYPIDERDTLFDPHVVKVVTDAEGYALYFSRAPIPWHRDEFLSGQALPRSVALQRHIGLYAYRAGFLRRFVGWEPAPIELAESLEQLRVLWHGEPIHVTSAATEPGPGVDTSDDVTRVEALLSRR